MTTAEFLRAHIAAVKSSSESEGISYAAWRAVGVSPGMLERAGISRSA
ncbi:MAG: hypothetical protein F2754_02520 [Actinobacteria bacterium]|uniref:Unannotated protein n=1 Tax=freshwater metagenome TaxID=449393 RepID=A0A6J6UQ94_9ZZZZ|nr:hypothetical protein [Actinomycetota bacterium]MSW91855.1 hypothetical protein [Actinomycetota bacterium]MSX86245.1 hypothetical protein [Actinomycetota bacterium]MSY72692.1 hypothetical protein [Actinomycetota bacterium]